MSLVDGAEQALRSWLAPGRHRPGDRLPPEHSLAEMLGVSRGTLRTALRRLEESGEIVRRQGSGTFVGRVAAPAAFDEGLERLVPYSALARRRRLRLEVAELAVDRVPLEEGVAAIFDLPSGTEALRATRLVLVESAPAAVMTDVVHPGVGVSSEARIRRALERGRMVLDVLIDAGVPISFAETRVRPRLVTGREREGRLLGVSGPTAMLELEEVMRLTSGDAAQYSRDLFGPGGLDLHVIRSMDAEAPEPAQSTTRRAVMTPAAPPAAGP